MSKEQTFAEKLVEAIEPKRVGLSDDEDPTTLFWYVSRESFDRLLAVLEKVVAQRDSMYLSEFPERMALESIEDDNAELLTIAKGESK